MIELGAGFHPELTGRENVFLNGAMLGFSQQADAGEVRRYRRILGTRVVHRFATADLLLWHAGTARVRGRLVC